MNLRNYASVNKKTRINKKLENIKLHCFDANGCAQCKYMYVSTNTGAIRCQVKNIMRLNQTPEQYDIYDMGILVDKINNNEEQYDKLLNL